MQVLRSQLAITHGLRSIARSAVPRITFHLPQRAYSLARNHRRRNEPFRPFGVHSGLDYPEQLLTFGDGDRFLIYTDGLLNRDRFLQAPEVASGLLMELKKWQRANAIQEDDITLIAIDVVEDFKRPEVRPESLSPSRPRHRDRRAPGAPYG